MIGAFELFIHKTTKSCFQGFVVFFVQEEMDLGSDEGENRQLRGSNHQGEKIEIHKHDNRQRERNNRQN